MPSFIVFGCSVLIVLILAYTLIRSVRRGFETLNQGAIRIGERFSLSGAGIAYFFRT